jgi:mRNA interferase HigB
MRVISKRRLREFGQIHPEAEKSLAYWYQITKKANWGNLVDVRKDFPHADLAGVCTIFNIGGNNFRLITKIFYPNRKVLIRFVMTHAEYNKKGYKNDCEC